MFPLKDENPVSRIPWVTYLLIALNIVVFVFPQGMNDPQRTEATFAVEWAAIPCEVVTGEGITRGEAEATFNAGNDEACDLDPAGRELFPDKPVRVALVFSMFMHAGWLHLGGNIWFLWIFGNNVEEHLGPIRYLLFYVAGGIAASIAHIWVQPDSTIPVVGASGAVAAVMGAYLVWFPNAPIRTFMLLFIWDIRAKWWLSFWLISQFFIGANSRVAWMAHVGGFVFGAVIAMMIRRSPVGRRASPWDTTGGAGRGPYPNPHRLRR